MPLTIKVIGYKGQPPVEQVEKSFDQDGGTLGRLPESRKNHLTLPDPEQYISRKHAFIRYESGCYYLTDTSVDGTYILNKNLRISHDTIQLSDGDKLRIGDYDLVVGILLSDLVENAPRSSADSPEAGSPLVGFDRDVWIQSESEGYAPGDMEESALHDSFALPDVVADTGQERKIPESFNPEELINVLDETGAASLLTRSDTETEPEDLSRETPVGIGSEPFFRSGFDREDKNRRKDAVTDPVGLAENPSPGVPYPIQQIRQQAHGELFKVFMEAAGVKDLSSISREDIPILMQTVGAVFREMIEGLMAILRGRAELKNQFRVSATVLKPADNNPLKFSRMADDALQHMLKKNQPGFVNAVDAVREGYADIMNHQLAMAAGIQAALIKLIERFDPKQFADRYEEGVVFQKKAKCWDAYRGSYPQIASEALEDFFGEAFAHAYEKQMSQLRPKNTKR